jgi:hypothetical protein
MPRHPCLLVADDYGQAIFRFDPGTGAFIDEFVPPTSVLAHPPGLDGNLYVASNVLFFHPDPPKTLACYASAEATVLSLESSRHTTSMVSIPQGI